MKRIRAVLILMLMGIASCLAACNIVAPIYYLLEGPPRTPAAYELADLPTVVFVDDRNGIIPRNSDSIRRRIGDIASTELMRNNVLTVTIRPQDALALAKQYDRHKEAIAIDAIGDGVGAQQVIYAEIVMFKESVDGVTPRPIAACRLKVLDVQQRVRLFPDEFSEQPSHMVEVTMPPVSAELYRSRDTLVQIYEMLAIETGNQIAKVFYEHETKELGGSLNPR
jgi:hypothetical protein